MKISGGPWCVLLAALAGVLGCSSGTVPTETAAAPVPAADTGPSLEAQLESGKALFASQCANCHGEKGQGDGPAAKYLYPRPHNFAIGRFRLVSTVNRVPSDQDLFRVLTRGMPGSAMFPFAHLSEADRKALVVYVRQLARTGLEERLRNKAAQLGEQMSPAELKQQVDEQTQPDRALDVPTDLPPPSAESVARGKELYQRCTGCHGKTGRGDGALDQRDDNGIPTRPRDFTRGIFKGGRDPASLFARIRLGIPGTPMPGSPDFDPMQIGDLIHFIQSLSDPASQERIEHKRVQLTAKRAKGTISDQIAEAEWQASPAVRVVVSPLWWRNDADADLQVNALHDGQSLAMRLSWPDDSRNERPASPQESEDMTALQLFKGNPEPAPGVSPADKPLDVWLWRPGKADAAVYPHLTLDPAINKTPPPTPRQLANLRPDRTASLTSAELAAKGVGNPGNRALVSKAVRTAGVWKDGRWIVVLRRPLDAKSDGGLPLAAGDKVSVSFAVWNGAAGDRYGQKQVSIWHDFQLEP